MKNRKASFILLLTAVTYLNQIKPLLDTHCLECHSAGNFLDLSWYPFHSQTMSEQNQIVDTIIRRVQPGGGQMPPGNRPKLSFEEIATIQKWREEGLNP